MPGREAFSYALLRVVPRVERGETVNAGIVLFCRRADFLEVRVSLDADRIRALDPEADLDAIAASLDALRRIAAGDASAGAVARQPISERFHWLVAPSSTVIQPSEVHTGLCDDPAATLDRLFETLVT